MVLLRFRQDTIATDNSRSYGPKQSPEISVDRCKKCGSESLFDGWFDKDGYANTAGEGVFTTICNDCGQDQNKRVSKRRKRD